MDENICVIIGANQAGVTCAFSLRDEGWKGRIVLVDADPMLPYYRPPLSKAALTGSEEIDEHVLKPLALYQKENVELKLGVKAENIDTQKQIVSFSDKTSLLYSRIVLATGARPLIPKITGIEKGTNIFTIRTASDALAIQHAIKKSEEKRVVIIGGGYIGLEAAASVSKMGAKVTVLERDSRVLARVTTPEMSNFFTELHAKNNVDLLALKNVTAIDYKDRHNVVVCSDNTRYNADVIIVGVGVHVNKELAEQAGIAVDTGIKVDAKTQTNLSNVYAIGDCTTHFNPIYERFIRLESVQNASDQAKVAAATICGKEVSYSSVPWFWSDQFDVKLQMVGLSEGYDEIIVRQDLSNSNKFSIWYFKGDRLLAVHAVNDAKAYMMGTKFIKTAKIINKHNLQDVNIPFKPANILL